MKIAEKERKKQSRHIIRERLLADRMENLKKERDRKAYYEYEQERKKLH